MADLGGKEREGKQPEEGKENSFILHCLHTSMPPSPQPAHMHNGYG